MKLFSTLTTTGALLVLSVTAIPAGNYPPPPGGWESVDYPPGTGEDLSSYPGSSSDHGGTTITSTSTSISKPSVIPTTTSSSSSIASPSNTESPNDDAGSGSGSGGSFQGEVFQFTSTYNVVATPDQVVNGTTYTGGLPGVIAYFDLGINSDRDLICWNIKLKGFRGEYQSDTNTATELREAPAGQSGPPRLNFPNPTGDGDERYSDGCMTGRYHSTTTGNRIRISWSRK